MGKTGNPKQIPVSKNYYLMYFLIAIEFIPTLGGLMTMLF
jgi:hypothetical protein